MLCLYSPGSHAFRLRFKTNWIFCISITKHLTICDNWIIYFSLIKFIKNYSGKDKTGTSSDVLSLSQILPYAEVTCIIMNTGGSVMNGCLHKQSSVCVTPFIWQRAVIKELQWTGKGGWGTWLWQPLCSAINTLNAPTSQGYTVPTRRSVSSILLSPTVSIALSEPSMVAGSYNNKHLRQHSLIPFAQEACWKSCVISTAYSYHYCI